MYGIIYEVTLPNDPQRVRYVGQTTKTLEERERTHYKASRFAKPERKTPMGKFLGKYGDTENRPQFKEVSRHKSRESLDKAEKERIALLKSEGMCDLNLLPGGQINVSESPETLLKMSKAQSGDKSHTAKLTWVEVREARERYLAGERIGSIIRDYCVGYQNMTGILRNRTWVDCDYTPPRKRPGKPRALSDSDILEVRERAQKEVKTASEWAREYGATSHTMARVLKNKTSFDPNFNPQRVLKARRGGGVVLSKEDAQEIRSLRTKEFKSSTDLARKYGCSPGAITAVLRNERWVDDNFNPLEVVPYEGQNARGRKPRSEQD